MPPLVLSDGLREHFAESLNSWLVRSVDHNGTDLLHEHEIAHVQRLIDYLDVVKTPHSEAFELSKLRQDFRKFYQQYDQRRGKSFVETFGRQLGPGIDMPFNLADWYNDLPI